MKKIFALLVAVLLIVASMSVAFAADAGSITLSNAETGAKYNLYKLFDATVAPDGKIAYQLKSGDNVTNDTFFKTYFDIVNGYVIAKDTFTESVLGTTEFKTWAAAFGTKVGDEVTATTGTITWSPIDYGYYYISSTVGAILTVDSANPAATVIDKNQTVSFDKNIVSGEDLIKMNEAGLAIDVPFDITVNAKNYEGTDKVFKYVIYDTMDNGWTMKAAPVVKVGGETLAATAYTISYKDKSGNATETLANAEYFEITIPWTTDGTKATDHLYDSNAKINVTYTAFLDPAKAADVKVGATPNLNDAQVKYFKGNDGPDTPSGDLGHRITKTWETALTIIKHDGQNNILTGAQFTLTSTNGTKVSYVYEKKYVAHTGEGKGTYYKLLDDTYTAEAPNGNTTHDSVYASTTDTYDLVEEAKVMGENQTPSTISSYVGADGTVKFSGLGTGTYKIEETVVPAGYNKADDIEFTISFSIDTKDQENPKGVFASSNPDVVLDATNNVFSTTVINNQGTELPSTGGIGTTIFYIGGSILVLAAVILLITKRRMGAND